MWKEVTEERYDEMLNILPPAHWDSKGFLVGEPWTHRFCRATGLFRAAFAAFVRYNGKFYECDEPLTVPEFVAFNPAKEL